MAWDGEAGFRPPTDRITSPALRGRLESAGARTTRMPSLVPKYSPKSGLRLTRDRKSIRLNSSHTVISYAVFCLKKKKKKQDVLLGGINASKVMKLMQQANRVW